MVHRALSKHNSRTKKPSFVCFLLYTSKDIFLSEGIDLLIMV